MTFSAPWFRFLSRHSLVSLALVIVLAALLARLVLVEGYTISDDAMTPSLQRGDHILVNKLTVGFRLPFTDARLLRLKNLSRGDLVIFVYPEDPAKTMVRRVAGLPGDTIEFRDKKLLINGSVLTEPYARHVEQNIIPLEQHPRDNRKPAQVPADSYFLLGDNRDQAYDSRFFGPVADRQIRGVVLFRYWRSNKQPESVTRTPVAAPAIASKQAP